ncbi:patatin-like phospholipase/acyl hydrolase [Collimonas sp. PA-H2]|uniref:patatin-like phospholipase family protein n=1 Tax=Collimonas sp. PA-H2 TaxID=1881062 RepID=UPI000BF3175D|nr:patatin-like phospholipase family protein [Collimonas sp. PA-H2]PFH07860.1 patatin-like phospholipase/acyl hydrolase [Collimonas sp. PA-H2]
MTFRILSLDGGGTWALIQARALQKIFGPDISGHEILSHFDLVTANSGGNLVLGGLIENWSPSKILQLFLDSSERSKIFVPLNPFEHPIDAVLEALVGLGPKFSTSRKFVGLRNLLTNYGDMSLDKIPKCIKGKGGRSPEFLIPAFDYDRQRAVFFRSDLSSLSNSSPGSPAPTLAQAIHASSTAPVNYFDQPAQLNIQGSNVTQNFWDGGVGGYNNPVLAGIIEAVANIGVPRYPDSLGSIRALSIGNGNTVLPIQDAQFKKTQYANLVHHQVAPGLKNDIRELATSILDDPPDAASFISHVVLGGHLPSVSGKPIVDGNLVRLNPLIQPVLDRASQTWMLPAGLNDVQFADLLKISLAAVKQNEVDLILFFCDAWIANKVPNQAIKTDSDLSPLIGHALFSDAIATWAKIK